MSQAPLWQYILSVVLFVVGSFGSFLSLGIIASMREDKIQKPGTVESSFGWILFRTLFSALGMYISFSLYQWYSGLMGIFILVVWWSSIISGYIHYLTTIGSTPRLGLGRPLWSLFYNIAMLAILVFYGVYHL